MGTARTCIIEVGRELAAAKAGMAHGDWLPWLRTEFDWDERTARNYMRVAEAFKSETVSDFSDLAIEPTALYALSTPEVPQSVRDGAIGSEQRFSGTGMMVCCNHNRPARQQDHSV